MSRKPTDSSGISFTALYTGAVWHRYGLSDDTLATEKGRWLYRLMTPFEAASKAAIGSNIQTFLLQRHLIIDPRSWYRVLPIPENRGEPMVRVIETGC